MVPVPPDSAIYKRRVEGGTLQTRSGDERNRHLSRVPNTEEIIKHPSSHVTAPTIYYLLLLDDSHRPRDSLYLTPAAPLPGDHSLIDVKDLFCRLSQTHTLRALSSLPCLAS